MIRHVKGDIFTSNADFILHQVNCQGVMGSGVAKQVREQFPWVYNQYKQFCDYSKAAGKNMLGTALGVYIDDSHMIINVFAQDNYGRDGKCYTDYDALRECLGKINRSCRGKTIAIPYLMGCHRGGGDWDIVSKMIAEELVDCHVTLWEYNGG